MRGAKLHLTLLEDLQRRMVLAEVAFNAYAPVFLQEGIDIPLPYLFRCPVSPWNLYREAIP